jgi:hypothetical protein
MTVGRRARPYRPRRVARLAAATEQHLLLREGVALARLRVAEFVAAYRARGSGRFDHLAALAERFLAVPDVFSTEVPPVLLGLIHAIETLQRETDAAP